MIGYPNLKRNKVKEIKVVNNAIKGMSLEKEINESNEYYKQIKKALIYKKPTPIQVVKVDYPKRSGAKISEAYYQIPSTTDYNGIYRKNYIDFEAKETISKSSFPFKNIHLHQIEHLRNVSELGGIAFIMIKFISYNETYLIDALLAEKLYKNSKSISYLKIKEIGILIKEGLTPRLKYLDVVDQIYFKEDLK
ncbi:MAG: Holliday junction resolvase RecU [Erysipelotrichaceae bacterium]